MDAVIKDSNKLVLSLLGESGGRERRTATADGRGSSIEITSLIVFRTDDPPYDEEPYTSEWIDYAKPIIGDKNSGFAVSLNPAFPTPSAGVYFRGFFVNVVLPNAWDDSWWAWDGEGFGIEAGYSLYFKSKLVSWMFGEE